MNLTLKEMQKLLVSAFKETVNICNKHNIKYFCVGGTTLGAIRHKNIIPWDDDIDIAIPVKQIDKFVKYANKELSKNFYVNYYKLDSKSIMKFPRIGIVGYKTNIFHVDIFPLIGMPNEKDKQIEHIKNIANITTINRIRKVPAYKYLITLQFNNFFVYLKNSNNKKILDEWESLLNKYDYDTSNYIMHAAGKPKMERIFMKDVFGEGIRVQYADMEVIIQEKYDYYLKQYYGDYMKLPNDNEIKEQYKKIYTIKKL